MKKVISMALVIVLALGLFPAQAFAADSAWTAAGQSREQKLGLADIGSSGYRNMKTSQMMLDVMKVMEGFSKKAYSDNTQYSIGYGTKAKSPNEVLPDGVAGYEEAERRLIADIKGREEMLNNYCRTTLMKQPNQQQFDALLGFTYNSGTGWFFNSRLASWLKNPTTEIDFMNAFGQWSHVGKEPWYGLAQRRIREALIFLKGQYYLPGKPGPEHLIKTEAFKKDPVRYVRPNGSLPYYASIIFDYDSPTESISGDRIDFRDIGGPLGTLPVPQSKKHKFLGWEIVGVNGSATSGGAVSSSTIVGKNLQLAARWDDYEFAPPSSANHPFVDVPDGAWYADKVEFVYKNGYMAGTDTNEFSPNMSLTRGMLVMVLYRLAGSPAVSEDAKNYFTDTQGMYYTEAVGWAKSSGIVSGVGDREFGPDRKITRQDAELIFYKFCVDYLGVSKKQSTDLSKYADIDELAGYANEAVQWAVAVGMMAGVQEDGKTYLNPQGNLTRAEAATLIMRCVNDIMN